MKLEFISEHKLIWAIVCLIVGLVMAIFGFMGVFYLENSGGLKETLEAIGNWDLWLALLGPILLIVGIWYTYDMIRSKKRFKELMELGSKAKFVKSRDEIEDLVWKLGSVYRAEWYEKKKKFKIK